MYNGRALTIVTHQLPRKVNLDMNCTSKHQLSATQRRNWKKIKNKSKLNVKPATTDLPFVSQAFSTHFLRHSLLIERTQLFLIVDFNQLLTAGCRKRDIQLDITNVTRLVNTITTRRQCKNISVPSSTLYVLQNSIDAVIHYTTTTHSKYYYISTI